MSETLRLNAGRSGDIERAATLLREGKTVAFPTETVYGLGANALDPDAVAAIFAAKQRPYWDPLIVHIASLAQLSQIATIPTALANYVQTLAQAFWPGPLTLLLPRSAAIPDSITAARPLVGVRIPAHPVALELLRLTRLPLAAPSANTFGHTSPTTAQHVLDDLAGRIDAVLDAGATTVGLESTVLDPAAMVVYRPGAVTLDELAAATGLTPTLYMPPSMQSIPDSLPSPGVGIRHYAPRAQIILTEGSEAALTAALVESTKNTGVLLPSDWQPPPHSHAVNHSWGHWHRAEELAANLFAGLRALDDRGVSRILVPLPSAEGIGQAIRDRLEKAARKA